MVKKKIFAFHTSSSRISPFKPQSHVTSRHHNPTSPKPIPQAGKRPIHPSLPIQEIDNLNLKTQQHHSRCGKNLLLCKYSTWTRTLATTKREEPSCRAICREEVLSRFRIRGQEPLMLEEECVFPCSRIALTYPCRCEG